MLRTTWITTLGLALLAGAVSAQDEVQTHAQKVRRYLDVSGKLGLGVAMRDKMIADLSQERGVPPGLVEAFGEAASPEALVERLEAVYQDLDDTTLDAAIAFYETPSGKKLAAAQAAHDAGVMDAINAWAQAAIREAMQAQGMPTPEESLREARRHGNEAAAIGALKTITTAQSLFREGDKDLDGEFNYADSMAALGKATLIDEVLASGTKQGYRFELCASSESPEFLWMAVATPIDPEQGSRHFVINQSGVLYYSKDTPFTLDRVKCQIPEHATPVGQ